MKDILIGNKGMSASIRAYKVADGVAAKGVYGVIADSRLCRAANYKECRVVTIVDPGTDTLIYLSLPNVKTYLGDVGTKSCVYYDDDVYVEASHEEHIVWITVHSCADYSKFAIPFAVELFREIFPLMDLEDCRGFVQVGSFEQGGPKCPMCGYVGNAYTFDGHCARCGYGVHGPVNPLKYVPIESVQIGQTIEWNGMLYTVRSIYSNPYTLECKNNDGEVRLSTPKVTIKRW